MNWYFQSKISTPNYFVLTALLCTTYLGYHLKKFQLVIDLQYFALLCFVVFFISAQIVVAADNRYVFNALGVGILYFYNLFNENQDTRIMKNIRIDYLPLLILTVLVT